MPEEKIRNEKFIRKSFAVMLCEFCGRTQVVQFPCIYKINVKCEHRELPGYIYLMKQIYPVVVEPNDIFFAPREYL